MRTILSVIYENDSGGAEILSYEFIRATQHKYRHVVVILNGAKSTLKFDNIACTYSLGYSVESNRISFFLMLLRYLKLVITIRPSAIISNAWIPLLFNVFVFPFFRVIQYHHSDFVQERPSLFRAFAIRLSGMFCVTNIVLTKEIQKEFYLRFGFQPECLSNPCRIMFDSTQGVKRNSQKTPKKLLFVGRLEEVKGISDLLKLIEILQPYNEFSWTIVGNGSRADDLLALENIRYIPYIENPGSIYLDSDYLILTSKYEGFGNVVVEALCAGCLPLTYSTSGTRAIHESTGLIKFPDVNTPSSMKDLILKTSSTGINLRSQDIIRVRKKFNLERWVASLEDIVIIK